MVVRPAGAAEDTVLSNRVARGGRQRLTPDGQGRLACPNPAGPKTSAAEQAAPLLFAPERVVILMNRAESGSSLQPHGDSDCRQKTDLKFAILCLLYIGEKGRFGKGQSKQHGIKIRSRSSHLVL